MKKRTEIFSFFDVLMQIPRNPLITLRLNCINSCISASLYFCPASVLHQKRLFFSLMQALMQTSLVQLQDFILILHQSIKYFIKQKLLQMTIHNRHSLVSSAGSRTNTCHQEFLQICIKPFMFSDFPVLLINFLCLFQF